MAEPESWMPAGPDLHVLLVANYEGDRQASMERFATLMHDGLAARGIGVSLVRPTATIAGRRAGPSGLAKWLGYADKFLVFPPTLRRAAGESRGVPSVVHICDHSNAMYVPWIRHRPHVVTCHDLLAVRSAQGEFPEHQTRWSGRRLQAAIVRGLRSAGTIMCDSNATRADVARLIHEHDHYVGTIYPGVAPAFGQTAGDRVSPRVIAALTDLAGPDRRGRFILHVGGNQWYKNRAGLLKIYAALISRVPDAPKLVIAGRALAPDLNVLVATLGLAGRVVELPGMTDDDLAAVYGAAALLLFPSWAEGFGWPVLEAMACGCRVVTSHRAPLTEIGGDVVTYVDPQDPVRAADVVVQVLAESSDERQARVTMGLARAAEFQCERMIDAYVGVYPQPSQWRVNRDLNKVVSRDVIKVVNRDVIKDRREVKRLLHIIRSASPTGGGPIEVVRRFSVELEKHGWNVEIASLDSPEEPWLADFPMRIHALGPVTTTYGYTPRLVPWLRSRAADWDMVVVNGLWQYGSFGAWRALHAGSVPYVVFPHGMLDPWFKRYYPLKHAKKWLYWPWAEYRVLRDAKAVLFTSEDERVRARESFWLYRCREQVISYGTARPPQEAPGERERFLDRFPELAGKRCLLFLGRMHEKKGCDLLIRAFASALRSASSSSRAWHLVMAGPPKTDEYRRYLERLVDETDLGGRVTWTGMLTGESKWAAFRAADAFVLPSHQENFGVAVVEALGCGVPVLISNEVNIWREVVSAAAGLVDSDDQPGTDRLLATWMSLDAAQQSRMRENAVTCFDTRFDVHEAATHLSLLLDQLR